MSVVELRRPQARAPAVGGVVSGDAGQAAQSTRAHLLQAIRSGDVALLPGRRDEAWRWTDLRSALRTIPAASPIIAAPAAAGPFAGVQTTQEIVILNGRRSDGDAPIQIRSDTTLALRFVSGGDRTAHGCELEIDVAPEATVTLLESYEGQGVGYVCAVDMQIRLGVGARLERLVIEDDAPDAISVSTADVHLSKGARFAQTVATTGAQLQRHETRLVHPGGGAEARLDSVYLLAQTAHADLTTIVEHRGRDGQTSQITKGVVAGRAHAVFQGRIVVAPGADGTDARLRHDSILLCDGAEVDAKPELQIYADDVQCAHGNTVGALDAEQLFYVRSRGVPEAEAKRLLMAAFVGGVVDRIEHDEARDIVGAWVATRLEGLS